MKKISFLIVIILITFLAKSQDVVIKRFLNPPSLDGIVDNIWNHIDTNYISTIDAANPATINKAYWKMGFTYDAFYVLFEVEDNSFCPPTCSGYYDWQSDRPDFS